MQNCMVKLRVEEVIVVHNKIPEIIRMAQVMMYVSALRVYWLKFCAIRTDVPNSITDQLPSFEIIYYEVKIY